ncbi:hypothetical protein QBC38DRAFT_528778 [Podospora fimiseda]|uniref:Uncharacterized protein n=1 Tax=Podospora fimiseda TaxID=252190 RepID=A0AAN7BXT3_9PEZI|nr:hypothetical protein QBC38DRAFT_528778 [Podospora fimiseda]
MMALDRKDVLRMRYRIPGILVQLNLDYRCYKFIKWWATKAKTYDWDKDGPDDSYLRLDNVGSFEAVDQFVSVSPCNNLSHLVILTLLKLRSYMSTNTPDRRVQHAMFQEQFEILRDQVTKWKRWFWGVLKEDEIIEVQVTNISDDVEHVLHGGSVEEAHRSVTQCLNAWRVSENAQYNAIRIISDWIPPELPAYISGLKVSTVAPKKIRGGNNSQLRVFPSVFKAQPGLFHSILTVTGEQCRFVARNVNAPRKVLLYVHGACTTVYGQPPKAGWAVAALPPDQITDQLFQPTQFNSVQFHTGFRSIKSYIKKRYLQISEYLQMSEK